MAAEDEKKGYVALYTYFYTRKRIGVIGNCYSGVKDMYIVPIASHDPIPPELKPFDGPGKFSSSKDVDVLLFYLWLCLSLPTALQ